MFIRGRRHDRQLVFKGAGPTVHLAEAHPGVRRSGRDVLPIEQVSHPLQQGKRDEPDHRTEARNHAADQDLVGLVRARLARREQQESGA